jgi:hypothetical protein
MRTIKKNKASIKVKSNLNSQINMDIIFSKDILFHWKLMGANYYPINVHEIITYPIYLYFYGSLNYSVEM